MFDRQATQWIRPGVDWMARRLHAMGVGANILTFTGFGIGVSAALLIVGRFFTLAVCAILLSRLLDALDGAVARLTTPTDRGGFLDITLDFLFYASIPLAFAVADPERNALAAAGLLAAFIGTGSSFLAFATIAAKRGMTSTAYPDKSFFFLGGVTEAGETLAFFVAMCLWPQQFALLGWTFCGLCVITIAMRIYWGWLAFK
ncbi:MAG: CDP-alcohol phosphatidyltransferase family protein [Burkholderiaceae bacterium]